MAGCEEWLFVLELFWVCYFFFFQAEDGIRDRDVTGVQTCALPIYGLDATFTLGNVYYSFGAPSVDSLSEVAIQTSNYAARSEERRVGKECRSRGSPDH